MQCIYGRHDDPRLVRCESCGWRGQLKDCVHGYAPVPPDDVEPMDYCPECGSDQIIDDDGEPAYV